MSVTSELRRDLPIWIISISCAASRSRICAGDRGVILSRSWTSRSTACNGVGYVIAVEVAELIAVEAAKVIGLEVAKVIAGIGRTMQRSATRRRPN